MFHGLFPTGWVTCPLPNKIKLKPLALFLDELLSLKSKSCVTEKMHAPALRFAYSHFYNNYVKNVSRSTCQTKLKKVLFNPGHVIRVSFM